MRFPGEFEPHLGTLMISSAPEKKNMSLEG